MPESCNSRGHFSWLMKSCFPNPTDNPLSDSHIPLHRHLYSPVTTLSSLPEDILLECLSRVPSSSLHSVSQVCRQWSRILDSSTFSDIRRLHRLLRPTVFALSSSSDYSPCLVSASLCPESDDSTWKVSFFTPNDAFSIANLYGLVSHARLAAIGSRIYIVGRTSMVCYDTWTGIVTSRSPMASPRKKFAAAACSGKIYVAGGGGRPSLVEEYDPMTDTWRTVAQAPRTRYGCIGASVNGVFYVIGGLRIGLSGPDVSRAAPTAEAPAYAVASSMDLYDVEARIWLRCRALPGGGCVVAACAASGHIYLLASHAVELSFWRFDARRKSTGFGEWFRLKPPPLPTQARLDSTVKFNCVGAGNTVLLIQVSGCIDDLLRRSGRSERGLKEGLVLMYDTMAGEWSRGADLPEVVRRAACAGVEC